MDITKLSAALPDQITLKKVIYPYANPNRSGDESYMDLVIEDGGILDGTFDGYCIDADRLIDFELDNNGNGVIDQAEIGKSYSAKVYSSYEELPAELVGPNLIEKPENLDLLNWILNQDFVSQTSPGGFGKYTFADVQRAIWTLIDDDTSVVGVGSEGYLWEQERVDEILNAARANGEGFVPTFGQKMGVIIVPDTDNNGSPDAQIVIAAVELSKLGDKVFEDSDADGIQDAAEAGIAGVTVNLLGDIDGNGQIESHEVIETTQTDANGEYSFTVVAGDYKVQFETPDGFDNVSPKDQGNNDAIDSDGLISDVVTLAPGEYDPTIDAGFYKQASLGDRVWFDNDRDGIQDAGEQGVEGVKVTLTGGGADGVIGTGDDTTSTTTTDANGNYNFDNLNPGEEYKVTFSDLPQGYEFTQADAGNDDAADSDADPSNGMTQTVILKSGENNTTLDAGIVAKPASLGDRVWFDNDRDGIQDAGEQGVEGVKVTLTGGGADGVIGTGDDTTATTTTDANGNYKFENLNSGEEYKVTLSNLPEGYEFTQANAGSDDGQDSDADPSNGMTQKVILAPGENNTTLDAGVVAKPASLGDRVWFDNDRDGIQDAGEQGVEGVKVTLTGGGADGVIGTDDDTTSTTTTDVNGNYNFDNLNPGEEYKVTFSDLPQGYEFTQADAGGDDTTDSDANPSNGMTQTIILKPGENNTTLDAGIVAKPSSLGDRVWFDNDRDGIQDAGEQGVEGVKVTLTGGGADGVIGTGDDTTSTTTTDANGNYNFDNLNSGEEYKVTFSDLPQGYEFTQADAGSDDAKDSDADPSNGMTQTVILKPGEHNPTLDAGIIEPANPGIDIEKFVNGIDVTDINNLPEIAAGADITFTYEVTNTGNVAFSADQVVVTDDHGTPDDQSDDFTPTLDLSSDVGGDGILSAGETWTYTSETFVAENLTTTTSAKDLQFTFTGNSYTDGYDGNIRTFTSDDVSVDVSAFRSDKNGSNFNKAYVGAYGGGLGVTNHKESGSGHRVDNSGSLDYLLFEFDKDIIVDKAFLKYVGNDSDISIWIGDRNGTDISHLNSTLLNSFTKENNFTQSSYSRWADFNNGELMGDTVIISAYTGSSNDSFKLNKLDVSVPGEKNTGTYVNIATVTAPNVSDSDESGYTNHNPVCAKLVGSSSINEGDKGYYKIQLDGVSDRDRYFDIRVSNGSAKLTNDNRAGHQDIMWGGYYDTRNRYGRVIKKTYGYIAQGRAGDTSDDRVAVGPGDASWDYTVYDQNGNKDYDGVVRVKVAAGESMSESFHVQTWKERVTVDRDAPNRYGYYEGTEKFSINLVSGDADKLCADSLHISINDRTHYNFFSPIALDINGDGVQTTAIGATHGTFDLLGNGTPIESGWLSGEDAFLAVDNNGNGIIDDISELFGGNVGEGFAKLATYDTDGDGLIGQEEILTGRLLLWQDANENHSTDEGELISLGSQGIVSLNTAYEETPVYQHGNVLIEHGSATKADGSQIDMVDAYFQIDGQANTLIPDERTSVLV